MMTRKISLVLLAHRRPVLNANPINRKLMGTTYENFDTAPNIPLLDSGFSLNGNRACD